MTYDAHIKPPTKPGALSDKLRGIPKGKSLYVPATEAPPTSIRTLVSRIAAKFGDRAYQTARERGGIRVWRTE
jgi:hypothetical protein